MQICDIIKMKKMKLGIFFHKDRVDEKNVQYLRELLGEETKVFASAEEIEGVDRLIVLGGDGSLLRAARRAAVLGIPIVGVNYGTIGFLADLEHGELQEAARLVKDGGAIIHRSMLEVEVNGKKSEFLNEIAFMRKITADTDEGVVRISVAIDNRPAGDFTADGLIVATPTGSTAYSLSAGGSILTPDCEAFCLTPVCAFSMRSRPIICSDKSELTFGFPGKNAIVLHGDGIFLGEVQSGDRVTVRKSKRYASFLTRDKYDFFRRLTEKII